jgi:beta-alanine--pyruvate transaminase
MFTRRVLTAASRSSAQATRSFSTAPKTTFDPFWMPFTDNHEFKADPRKVFERAEGSYYYLEDGTPILDGVSGLWCCNAGHSPPKIAKAIADAAGKLDFAPCFNTGHKAPAIFAQKILDLLPNRGFEQVFFTMCGSTAVDSALKIALQYHRAKGEGTRVKFIGRERGYHGVGFGGALTTC